ncbi:MAG: flagellar basal-body MS-ring/collar protein FliF [Ignavibacteriales bacterium]|nr:flagellar basal-body MS-ring/collar protein FliF [Ignavibacteriales bacterium]
MEQKNSYLQNIFQIFNKLSIQQRLLIGGVFIVSMFLFILVLFFLNEPNYQALYTNLAQEDASKVVEYLTSQKIPYKIEDNGQTIRVAKEKVYEARLALAGKGIPNSGIVGYEIFDKTTMGMSEFMQKLNYKRALEGELSRTITQQNGIVGARVHIVFPAKSVFKEEQKEPTASVVLKINQSFELTQNNVLAISHLIASSVEGLTPARVTIVDTKGRLLSKELNDNALNGFTSKQYEVKTNVENYLAGKAQNILDNVLGYGNAIVKVNAELDFNQVEKTMEQYDPESQVAISEQTNKAASGGKSLSDSNSVNNENSITNYEVSKTIEKVIAQTGAIRRLTVAAVINGVTKEVTKGDKVEKVVNPRTEEQMKQLEQIVRQAVGIDPVRNDQISIINMSFENPNGIEKNIEEESVGNSLEKWINLVVIIASIIAAMIVLRILLKRLKNEKIVIGTYGQNYGNVGGVNFIEKQFTERPKIAEEKKAIDPPKKKRSLLEIGDITDEISDEAITKQVKHEKLTNYVAQNPVEAARLINLWLREDEY